MSSRKILAFPGFDRQADNAEDFISGVRCEVYHLMEIKGLETLHLYFLKNQIIHSSQPEIIYDLSRAGFSLREYSESDNYYSWIMQKQGKIGDVKTPFETSLFLLNRHITYHPFIELPKNLH